MSGASAWLAKSWCLRLTHNALVQIVRRHLLDGVAVVAGGVVDQDGDRPQMLYGRRRPRRGAQRWRGVGVREVNAGIRRQAGQQLLRGLPIDR